MDWYAQGLKAKPNDGLITYKSEGHGTIAFTKAHNFESMNHVEVYKGQVAVS